MQIWGHALVKNEDRYLWYAISSVIKFVDKVLLWDTGSSDDTLKIVESLKQRYPSKIKFREIGEVNPEQFTVVRQKMLEESACDWVVIVDGDEVWWEDKIKETTDLIHTRGQGLDSLVSQYYNVIGDIYHFQDELAGRYNIDGKVGNFNIRAFNRKIKGLKFKKPHGQQGLFDFADRLLQEREQSKRFWVMGYSYLHFTNMPRSRARSSDLAVPKRAFKLKYELGNSFPLDFYYPEVFFEDRPEYLKSVWTNMDLKYQARSFVETPFKKVKRQHFSSEKSGY
ncbi:MAG: Glycosyl transferase family 2 [Candidatus Woesebacteria bacterium GW2011_GWA1_39_21]|uniref:Glycosyl transferase family 2 n=1 Tax=Candidatus Woesebacteria bacterium GW2011_GWA1_39_21 TaxID=1618550 RepID=A0A0G0QMZ1_9BACT|nr:MAG: Glycosyl transferase family 2 [Candidatus Woesebacteria bacterium GW2011_GWA1_39_21]